jgi:hypothetical protein
MDGRDYMTTADTARRRNEIGGAMDEAKAVAGD